jgi:hypothetical protein
VTNEIEAQHQWDDSDQDKGVEGDTGDPPDVDISTLDATGETYAFGLNNGFYVGRRHEEEEQWRNRFPAMFPVFLACQQKTGDWSKADTHCKDWKEPCNCSGVLHTFDVLDLMCKVYCLLSKLERKKLTGLL